MLKQTKVLVTGGTGFIGSNLVDFLISNNHEVIVIDKNKNDRENPKATYYYLDITNSISNAKDIFYGVDCVFHLAAEIYVQKSLEFPDLFFDVNERGTESIIRYAKDFGVKNFVFSSTSAIYGNADYGRGSLESDPADCLNAYSLSKYNAESICKIYSEEFNMNVSVLRYFNVYGHRQHESGQYAPVIGKFLKQKLNNESLTVVGDGLQERDFINVEDVVSANYEAYKNNKGFEIYNIGFGDSISIVDLACMISSDISFIDPRQGECLKTLANIEKAKSALNWKPLIGIGEYLNERV
jgi:UDP-glucose 4-epimerase